MKNKRIKICMVIFAVAILCILVDFWSISKGTYISKHATIALPEKWTIEGADAEADYVEGTLLYNKQEVGYFMASIITELDPLNKDSKAESYVNVLLGMHAELQDSEAFELNDKGETLHKAYVTKGVSAAEAERGEKPENMIYYFGVSDKETLICVELLDFELEKEFEEILKTLCY